MNALQSTGDYLRPKKIDAWRCRTVPLWRAQSIFIGCLAAFFMTIISEPCIAAGGSQQNTEVIDSVIKPLMARYGIPGMGVGLVTNGDVTVVNLGVVSKASGQPVDDATLFEIGSISKTFTASLAEFAQISNKLALADMASQDLQVLQGSSFDHVSLLNLGTHTSGGLPLLVPETITDDGLLMAYFRAWRPTYRTGAYRLYSNPSIGLLGMVAASRLGGSFNELMETRIFAELGLHHTFLTIPTGQLANYAQGYTSDDVPVRMKPGMLAAEAYGVRTTAGDMAHFLQANMSLLNLKPEVQSAITGTHTGYFRLGAMTQDLIWEQYRYPVSLKNLLAGNSAAVLFKANRVTRLEPPLPPQDNVFINKTGSTAGFAAYAAFIPSRGFGIILLANKSYPIEARVRAVYLILEKLDMTGPGH
jgi:beta-lactamase class C